MTKAELIAALQADTHPDDYRVEVEVLDGAGQLWYPDVYRASGDNATDGYVCLVAR